MIWSTGGFRFFFLSFGLFVFHVLLYPVSEVVLNTHSLFLVFGVAPMGLALGHLSLIFFRKLRGSSRAEPFYGFVLGALILSSFMVAALLKKRELNSIVLGENWKADEFYSTIVTLAWSNATPLALVMSLPFVFFGFVFSWFIASRPTDQLVKLIFLEMLGAFAGSFSAPYVLDAFGFATTLNLTLISLTMACIPWPLKTSFRYWWPVVTLLLITAIVPYSSKAYLEPSPHPSVIGRDYKLKRNMEEISSSWTTYGRTSLIRWTSPSGHPRYLVGLNNGECNANVYSDTPKFNDFTVDLSFALGSPESMLVLFAGTGREISHALEYQPVPSRIVGVEINPTILRMASELVGDSPQRLVQADARQFLETNTEKFDVILYSWSGASVAHHLGTIGHTTQYSYTFEALKSAMGKLTSTGFMLFMNTNKINLIAAFREILDGDVSRQVILLYHPDRSNDWRRGWEDLRLLVKPSGFSDEDVAKIGKAAAQHGYKVAVAPDLEPHPDFLVHQRLLRESNWRSYLRDLSEKEGIYFGPYYDNRPYVMLHTLPLDLGSLSFWAKTMKSLFSDARLNSRPKMAMFSLLIGGSLALIGIALIFIRAWNRRRLSLGVLEEISLPLRLWIWGAAFFAFEIAFIQMLALFFGTPTHAIAMGVGVLLLGSGLGALIFEKRPRFWGTALFLPAGILGLLMIFQFYANEFFFLPYVLRIVAISIPGFASAIASGYFYSRYMKSMRGLSQGQGAIGLASNAFGAAAAICIGPLILENHGTTQLAICALVLYLTGFVITVLEALIPKAGNVTGLEAS